MNDNFDDAILGKKPKLTEAVGYTLPANYNEMQQKFIADSQSPPDTFSTDKGLSGMTPTYTEESLAARRGSDIAKPNVVSQQPEPTPLRDLNAATQKQYVADSQPAVSTLPQRAVAQPAASVETKKEVTPQFQTFQNAPSANNSGLGYIESGSKKDGTYRRMDLGRDVASGNMVELENGKFKAILGRPENKEEAKDQALSKIMKDIAIVPKNAVEWRQQNAAATAFKVYQHKEELDLKKRLGNDVINTRSDNANIAAETRREDSLLKRQTAIDNNLRATHDKYVQAGYSPEAIDHFTNIDNVKRQGGGVKEVSIPHTANFDTSEGANNKGYKPGSYRLAVTAENSPAYDIWRKKWNEQAAMNLGNKSIPLQRELLAELEKIGGIDSEKLKRTASEK